MADTNKTLTTHEALHELHKGLTAQVKDWEQKCLDLRKAELAKALPGELAHSSESAPPPPPPAPVAKDEMPGDAGAMAMAECKGDAMCKCAKCEGMDKWAKGEMPAGSAPTSPGPKPGITPDDKKPKMAAPKTQAGGNDGTDIKKAALPGAAPAPAAGGAPKLPGAGMPKMPKMPKLPGAGASAKPAAPAAPVGGAKPPAMGAGTPALKNELVKGVLPPGSGPRPSGQPPQTRDQQAQAIKLPGVRASVGGLMDNMLAGGPKPLNPGQPLSITPIASSAAKQPGAHLSPGQGLMTKTPPAPATAAPMVAAKASAMPAGQPGAALVPPAAGARPPAIGPAAGPTLPGAHLFAAKPAAHAVK